MYVNRLLRVEGQVQDTCRCLQKKLCSKNRVVLLLCSFLRRDEPGSKHHFIEDMARVSQVTLEVEPKQGAV